MLKTRAQTTLEYTVLVIIVIGAFLATTNYMKRGIAGRWKSAVDDLGDQYDPRTASTLINYNRQENTEMRLMTVNDTVLNGVWTNRVDQSNSLETKSGDTLIGGT